MMNVGECVILGLSVVFGYFYALSIPLVSRVVSAGNIAGGQYIE